MHIWIGCRLPEEFEREIRTLCLEKNRDLGLDEMAFSLPQHISLKISFETAHAEEILEDLPRLFAAVAPFRVEMQDIEQNGSILWMTVVEHETLRQLHEMLDEHLNTHFGIAQHLFDTCFQFHSTLFIDPDGEKLEKMKDRLADVALPRELTVNTILLGASDTGKPGTYTVVRTIDLR